MNPLKIRRLTLLQALAAPQVPFWICIFLGMAGALWYIGEVDSLAYDLNEQLHSGQLSPQELNQLTSRVRNGWLVGLVLLVLSGLAGSLLVMSSYRVVSERLTRLVEYAERRARGEEVAAIPILGAGPISKLEVAVMNLSSTAHERDEALRHEIALSHFDSEFQRALEMTDTEQEALDIVELSLQLISPGVSAELLLADPGQSKLDRVATSRDRPAPGCPVTAPKACSAIRRGQTMRFGSSEALDACPRLREHSERPCAAICTPLNVMGHSIGVLHLTSSPESLPGERSVDLLEVLASKTGARLGMLRTLASTQLQAQTDPLTGLLNRRSFEAAVAALLKEGEGQQHAVVLADLDHFKKLNDTEGHEAGDNALRLFSETLRDCLRPQDVIGRHGGEEFVVLLKGCKGEHARDALERLRRRLRDHLEHEGGPGFTASFGVAVFPTEGATLGSLLRKADRALYEAKRQGRDRVVMHGEVGLPTAHTHEQRLLLAQEEEEEVALI